MKENFDIDDFTLTLDDMATITRIDECKDKILNLHSLKEIERLNKIKCENL